MDSQRIILHLSIRVKAEKQIALVSFLQEALPFYEKPSGIKIRLLQNRRDPEQFLEIVEYDNPEIFEQDNERVNFDVEMNSYLERWRALLASEAEVEIYQELTNQIQSVG